MRTWGYVDAFMCGLMMACRIEMHSFDLTLEAAVVSPHCQHQGPSPEVGSIAAIGRMGRAWGMGS